ncbi:uncharacterized protein LOC135836084 isoform X2 [Planococcus citri]|uniref:uncharacterized protein LOC135836084 isoform X2 n=1 Tax=Planococcus citri TaxID=170843 RepID=UPI0031F74A0E
MLKNLTKMHVNSQTSTVEFYAADKDIGCSTIIVPVLCDSTILVFRLVCVLVHRRIFCYFCVQVLSESKMYSKILFSVLLLGSLDLIDAVFSQCPAVSLSHGKIRYLNRGKKIRFTCFRPYTLIGNPRLDCRDGEWNGAPPVCASKNCDSLPKLHHGKITYYNDRAVAKIQCDPDFTLIGPSDLHCEVQGWNDTTIPECLANSVRQFGSCQFESNQTQQCKWISKSGLFNWTVMSSDPKDNSHMPPDSFPARDHTSLSNSSGHFLYLEGLFAPTKAWLQMMDTKNAPARYISPLLPPIDDEESYCLIFYLYANGTHAGIIEVSANGDSLWKSNGSLGTEWNKIKLPLHNRTTQFRITIAGKGELGQYTKTAIDDLRIAEGEECQDENHQTEESTDDVVQTSTSEAPVRVTAIIENTLETERSNELKNHLLSFTTSPPHESNKSIVITTPSTSVSISTTELNFDSNNLTVDNYTGTSTRPINKNDISEESNAPSKAEEIPTTTSSYEILMTENNLVYHGLDENKSNDSNNIIVEEEVHNYSPKYHENNNELHTEISTTTLPPAMKREFQRVNQAILSDLSALQQFNLTKENSGVTEVLITKTTHSTTVSNDAVVESNDAKYEYDQEEDNRRDEIYHEGNDPHHSENTENVLENSHHQNEINNDSPYSNKSSTDQIISNKIFWAILIAITCVMLLVVISSYKRYRNKNTGKDDSFMQFIKDDSGKRGSSRGKKDDILMMKMNCKPQK